jgi:hypothetical protein
MAFASVSPAVSSACYLFMIVSAGMNRQEPVEQEPGADSNSNREGKGLAVTSTSTPTDPVEATFLIARGGIRIPTDGPLKVEEVAGEFYIVGRSSWERCESNNHARDRLEARIRALDPNALVADAVESDRLENSGDWETNAELLQDDTPIERPNSNHVGRRKKLRRFR